MRKILVVLLVLSVLGGAFAQDGWSVSGTAEIGTILNLYDDGSDMAKIGAHAYNRYGWYGDVNGTLTVNYSQGGLNAFIGFDTAAGISTGFTFTGDRFVFCAEKDLIGMLGGFAWDGTDVDFFSIVSVGKLWGYYTMLNDMVHMEIAYVSRDTNFWNSDGTAGDMFEDFGYGYASVDGENYFLTNLLFSGLEIGVMIPGVFAGFGARDNDGRRGRGTAINGGWPMTPEGYHPSMEDWEYRDLIDGVFKQLVAGMKFTMHPIEFAAQFSMADYGAYLGAKWFVGPLTLGLNFQGEFDTTTIAAIGASAAYNAGQFGAKVGAGFFYVDTAGVDPVIGVMPSFFYHVLPDNMSVSLDALFRFGNDNFYWEFTPQIFWNFKGTGFWGADYWAVDTGMIIRYYAAKDSFNALDITFKWNF